MNQLDNDLEELSNGATSSYQSEREPAMGIAQIWAIQAIRNLTATIKKSNKENSELSRRVFWLTAVTALLAFIQVVTGIVQIFKQ